MPKIPVASEKSPEELALAKAAADLSKLVRKAMIEAAQLRDIQERVTEVAERISKLTPPPDEQKQAG